MARNRVVCLFSEEETRSIKEEFDYRERLKDRTVNEDDVSIFTVHNLDTSESAENGADMSKSTILAPFNSNEPHEQEFLASVESLIVPKRTLKFSSKLREFDRQYERNNNSKLDNGVYVAPPTNGLPKGTSQPFSKGSSHDKGPVTGLTGRSTMGSTTLQSFSSTAPAIGSSTVGLSVDQGLLPVMEKLGFDRSFVMASIGNNDNNCATTLYYLLSED